MQNQPQPTPQSPIYVDPLTFDVLTEVATTYQVLSLALDSVRVLAENATAAAIAGRLDQEKAAAVLHQAQRDVLDAFAKLASGDVFKPDLKSENRARSPS